MNSEFYVGQRRKWHPDVSLPPFTITGIKGGKVNLTYDGIEFDDFFTIKETLRYSVALVDMDAELELL